MQIVDGKMIEGRKEIKRFASASSGIDLKHWRFGDSADTLELCHGKKIRCHCVTVFGDAVLFDC